MGRKSGGQSCSFLQHSITRLNWYVNTHKKMSVRSKGAAHETANNCSSSLLKSQISNHVKHVGLKQMPNFKQRSIINDTSSPHIITLYMTAVVMHHIKVHILAAVFINKWLL